MKTLVKRISEVLREFSDTDEKELVACLLGYALGRLIGCGATRHEARELCMMVIQAIPESPEVPS